MNNQIVRDRAVRLFNFLRQLSELRTKTIRSIDSYEQVVWISEIPREKGCFSIAWNPSQDVNRDIWIEVHKPEPLPLPKVPKAIEAWIISSQLKNSSIERPQLSQKITKEEYVRVVDTDEPKLQLVVHTLNEHPEIVNEWNDYYEKRWLPWANNDRIYQKVHKVYTELFSMYQHQQRLGEAYELILGIGLLTWETPTKQKVKRHLLTAQTRIQFDPQKGKILVGPSPEGPNITLEQDMLEPGEQPDSLEISFIDEILENLDEDIWNKHQIDAALKSWINTIPSSKGYQDILEPQADIGIMPLIHYAPALVLRKRTERSLVRAFKEISDYLKNETNSVPLGIDSIAKDPERGTSYDDKDILSIEGKRSGIQDNEIYFPLPSNDEQVEIAKQIATKQGVLVQGPPGTGKSHTIANLICHLLAQGLRVLVTSHTPRALVVLRDKIPAEIAPLCVVALSDDAKSFKGLEASVAGITARHNIWNSVHNEREINRLTVEIDELRKTEAVLLQDLKAIREAETLVHPKKFGHYSGTLQEIASQVKSMKEKCSWVVYSPAEELEPPLSDDDFDDLVTLTRNIAEPLEQELKQLTADPSILITPSEFAALLTHEEECKSKYKLHASNYKSTELSAIEQTPLAIRLQLKNAINIIAEKYDVLSRDFFPWVRNAADQILSKHDLALQELLSVTRHHLSEIEERVTLVSKYSITGIEGRNRQTLRNHAEGLLNHLTAGGKLGFWKLRPKVVSESLYIIDEIKVNGQACRTPEILDSLINWLDVNEHFSSLEMSWRPFASPTSSSPSIRKAEYQSYLSALEKCFELKDDLEAARCMLKKIPGVTEPSWHDIESVKAIAKLIDACNTRIELTEALNNIDKFYSQIEKIILDNECHPAYNAIAEAIKNRDVQNYSLSYQKLIDLYSSRERLQRRNSLLLRLSAIAPFLADSLQNTCNEPIWDERISKFTYAWNWARANAWIGRVSDSGELKRIRYNLEQIKLQVQKKIAELAAAKAWRFCLTRLTEHESGHLRAWQLAVKRIGKGTGVRANEHRRNARHHMDQCRSAIPAWIMPIYRVAETIEMKPNIFDVVIIDEASQSGAEALFLQFIAKKIVVVGDNKQISPQFVGVDKDAVDLLRKRLIPDLPFNDSLGVENSFFDQAFIRYKGQICLREHFRCMPEIIQFSNNLCYPSTPLIPLKQFGAGRLSPTVQAIHVVKGYQKGRSPRVTNPPEAEAIASHIKKCCDNPVYNGKTFGVISLLGEEQARLIYTLLVERIGPIEMEERQLICGDSYAFQGDERDVIVLSMVSAPGNDHRIATLTSSDAEKRFNVAASRAKEQMILFHSVLLDDLNPQCLRYRLLDYCQNPKLEPTVIDGINIDELQRLAHSVQRAGNKPPQPFDSWFEVDVFLDITARGYRVLPQHEVAGYRIDLVVEGLQGRLAVECDGDKWHGPEQYEFDMARQRQLERSGYTFWRVLGSTYYSDPDLAMNDLWKTLRQMCIFPNGKSNIVEDKTSNKDIDVLPLVSSLNEDITSKRDRVVAILDEPSVTNRVQLPLFIDSAPGNESQNPVGADTAKDNIGICIGNNQGATEDLEPFDSGTCQNVVANDSTPTSEILTQTSSTRDIESLPYINWQVTPLPDPQNAAMQEVMEGLVEIVRAEGPIICHRVYRLYATSVGIQRVSKQTRSIFNKALVRAVRAGVLQEENEHGIQDQQHKIVRVTGTPKVSVRQRGDRSIEEIPPAEIAKVIGLIISRNPAIEANRDNLYRSVLNMYELVRMTEKTRGALEKAWAIYRKNDHKYAES